MNEVCRMAINAVAKYVHCTGLHLFCLGWLKWTHFMTSTFYSYKVLKRTCF